MYHSRVIASTIGPKVDTCCYFVGLEGTSYYGYKNLQIWGLQLQSAKPSGIGHWTEARQLHNYSLRK